MADGHTDVRALLFDVFGTCVDWRSGVIREGEALGRRHGVQDVEWGAFADAWRALYEPQMERVRSGQRPWVKLDVLHRESLERVVREFGIAGIPSEEMDEYNRVWHRLDPWPDTRAGLMRLKTKYVIAPHSNGHIALLVHMAKRVGLPWDAILGAEVARAYKPAPEAYGRNVEALDLRPGEVMMVAAHRRDLHAAGECGLRTAFVPRPLEYGPGRAADPPEEHTYDVVASDFVDLARQLGC